MRLVLHPAKSTMVTYDVDAVPASTSVIDQTSTTSSDCVKQAENSGELEVKSDEYFLRPCEVNAT